MKDNNISKDNGRIKSLEGFSLLAGGLAHDYNNMLTAMLGNIDLILCDDISESVRETAQDIKSVMLRAATLVKRMLSYASNSEPHNEEVDVNTIVKDIVRIMKRAIPDNAVVNITPQQRVPLVYSDVASLWQVIMNLIMNGCDALNGAVGLIKVGVSHKKLSSDDLVNFIAAGQILPGDYVELVVEDSGCGMDEATISKIFEPLFTTKTKGNGLGLPSVLSILGDNKGGIKVESVKGKGSTFTVILPAHKNVNGELLFSDGKGEIRPSSNHQTNISIDATQNTASDPTQIPSENTSPSEANKSSMPRCKEGSVIKTILVVDDDVSIVKLIKIILEKSKCYKVISAYNGEQGLSLFKQNKDEISLCLVDASMGAGMNGIDLCSAIRTESQSIPFILMSAYRAKEMSTRMVTAGVSAFLAKPFRGSDVLDACSKFLFSQEA